MGTATFALPSLNFLFEKGYEISGVITQPDKPSGRGQSFQPPPVKKRACELHLPVHQPLSLKTDEMRQLLNALSPEVIVVVAYGKILPPWLLQSPRYGCINVHGSLLPKYRGAAPVHWAIANGESKTGVCTMVLEAGLDTGPVYLCDETDIDPEENVSQLYDRLADLGAPLLDMTLRGIFGGTLKPAPQDDSQSSMAPILKKENGFIDWNLPALQIHNRVRAFNPWPGTVTKFRGSICKILETRVVTGGQTRRVPGLITLSKRNLSVVCGDGVPLEILSVQPENRKPVKGADFANGARIQLDEKFGPVMDN
jgi:methionyl-tRNA formyltransferase